MLIKEAFGWFSISDGPQWMPCPLEGGGMTASPSKGLRPLTPFAFVLAMLVAGSAWAVEVELPKAEAPFPPVDETEEAVPVTKLSGPARGFVADVTCGDIGFSGLKAEQLDGTSFYFRLKTEEVISKCGGSCRGRVEECRKTCPPKEWTCPPPQKTGAKT